MGVLEQRDEIVDGPEIRVDGEEVADVVAAVAERRRVERQQPQAVDPEPLEVVELFPQAPRSPIPSPLASKKPRMSTS